MKPLLIIKLVIVVEAAPRRGNGVIPMNIMGFPLGCLGNSELRNSNESPGFSNLIIGGNLGYLELLCLPREPCARTSPSPFAGGPLYPIEDTEKYTDVCHKFC